MKRRSCHSRAGSHGVRTCDRSIRRPHVASVEAWPSSGPDAPSPRAERWPPVVDICNYQPSTSNMAVTGHSGVPISTDSIKRGLYQDVKHAASVHLEENGNRVIVEGILGSKLRIEPVRGLSERGDEAVAHRVYTVEAAETYVGDAVHSPSTTHGIALSEREDFADSVLADVCIVVDSVHNNTIIKSGKNLHVYITILMNAVNMRYGQLRRPGFQMKLQCIMRLSDRQERSKFNLQGNSFEYQDFLPQFVEYISSDAFMRYGAVFLFTGRNMLGRAGTSTTGVAYLGTLCTEHRVGIAEDIPGTYSAVRTASHEMLHIVGVLHDGVSPPSSEPGHPGARSCSATDHIMAPRGSAKNSHVLSRCTKQQLAFFFMNHDQRCWKSFSGTLTFVRRRLPGSQITVTAFCKMVHKNGKSGVLHRNCSVKCEPSPPNKGFYAGLDGWSCGDRKMCITGRCLKKEDVVRILID
ncbi:venom metalloproteinase BumaMPs1-like [Ornithodoros turicata]|uniref:venom metalloproteinase BumaMPs1-like n=1 Tax=Ornithodoros turicata TaxID=34597 RepID=UPI003138EA35